MWNDIKQIAQTKKKQFMLEQTKAARKAQAVNEQTKTNS
jgi:hypothetical protein